MGQLCVPEWCFASVLSYMIYQMFFTRKCFRAMTASINTSIRVYISTLIQILVNQQKCIKQVIINIKRNYTKHQ